MNDMLVLYSEIKRDLKAIKIELSKINLSHAQRLGIEWNRKDKVLKVLGISDRTLSRLTSSGKLPCSKINGIIYIKSSDMELLLHTNYHNQN